MHNSTLKTGEEPKYKTKNHYLNPNAEIPMSDNAHHNPQIPTSFGYYLAPHLCLLQHAA